jgi:biopolymer transport protein ExbD
MRLLKRKEQMNREPAGVSSRPLAPETPIFAPYWACWTGGPPIVDNRGICIMAMSLGTRSGTNETMAEMNTTPLIDVMLVLLVMLIVTLPIQTHAFKLDIASGPSAPPPVVHVLAVDFDGAIMWDNAPVHSRAALDAHFAQIAREPQQDRIEVLPNRFAKYGLVARIMSDAQRMGVKRIGFTGEEQYLR